MRVAAGGGHQRRRSGRRLCRLPKRRTPPNRRGLPDSAFGIDRQQSRIDLSTPPPNVPKSQIARALRPLRTLSEWRAKYCFGSELSLVNSMQIFGDRASPCEAIRLSKVSSGTELVKRVALYEFDRLYITEVTQVYASINKIMDRRLRAIQVSADKRHASAPFVPRSKAPTQTLAKRYDTVRSWSGACETIL
ncbi:unnamed protein product, partial [Iphiclides podalirius]